VTKPFPRKKSANFQIWLLAMSVFDKLCLMLLIETGLSFAGLTRSELCGAIQKELLFFALFLNKDGP
jgi:hypothetical protein